jgi:TRAP-type C4-dicarboxylate transport system substrate-binding protein
MSTYVWESLNDQEQKWLQESIDESVDFQRILWQASSDHAIQEVQKAGVEIFKPDKTPFREKVIAMHESYRGTPIYDLIMQIDAVQEEKTVQN